MTIFFAAAFMVLTIAALALEARVSFLRRHRAALRRRRGGRRDATRREARIWALVDPKWRAIVVLTIVFVCFLGVFIDTVSKANTVTFATIIGGPIGSQAAAGALAGTALAWSLSHARRLRSLKFANLAEAGAVFIIPVVVFFAAAFLSDPHAGAGLRSFEIGGLAKVELAATSQLAGGSTQREVQRQILLPSSTGGGSTRRPHLPVLLEYVEAGRLGPVEDGIYARDLAVLTFLENAEIADAGAKAWNAQRELLHRLRPFIECVQTYVEESKDRPLIAVALARPLLQLAMLERSWRTSELQVVPDAEVDPRDKLKLIYERFAGSLDEPTQIMRQYIDAAAGKDKKHCDSADVSRSLGEEWQPPYPTRTLAPHIAIFAAWSFSAVGSYELAVQTLSEWIDKFRDEHRKPGGSELTGGYPYWFELRAALEMAAIAYHHEQNASESRLARRLLSEVDKTMKRNPKFPSLIDYARDRRARCSAEVPDKKAERDLLNLRREITVRLLHAVIDNEDRERELGAADLILAQQLRDLDPRCLPTKVDPSLAIARQATSKSTYARVALVWAKKAEDARMITSEAADELRRDSKREARAAMALFTSADAQWRSDHGCAKNALVERLECDSPFMADFARARSLWLDIAGTGE